MFRKLAAFLGLLLTLVVTGNCSVQAELLKGRVQEEREIHRINRPAGSAPLSGHAEQTRIPRPAPAIGMTQGRGLVDSGDFGTLPGRASNDGFRLGVVKAGDFAAAPPKNFDLGAERGSKEMVLAWERWHRQLSEVIYKRWSDRADRPGKATVRVTVTRDRHIRASILASNGGPGFEDGLRDSILGLNGNPGLTFPSKSKRQQVTFEADYIAASDIRPGYSWVKNDYERVRESW